MKRIVAAFALASIFVGCNNNEPLVKGSRTEIDSVKIVQESIRNIKDSLRLDSFEKAEKRRIEEQHAYKASHRSAAKSRYSRSSASSTSNSSVRSANYEYQPAQPQPIKKGWSSAAKGAVIGAGAGAVTGILIDKKDGRGAIIGGVVGAGTGYAIGRSHDRKTGRVQKRN